MPATALHKPLLAVTMVTIALLLLPAVARQFTSEFIWGPGDFVTAGILLFGAGAVIVAYSGDRDR